MLDTRGRHVAAASLRLRLRSLDLTLPGYRAACIAGDGPHTPAREFGAALPPDLDVEGTSAREGALEAGRSLEDQCRAASDALRAHLRRLAAEGDAASDDEATPAPVAPAEGIDSVEWRMAGDAATAAPARDLERMLDVANARASHLLRQAGASETEAAEGTSCRHEEDAAACAPPIRGGGAGVLRGGLVHIGEAAGEGWAVQASSDRAAAEAQRLGQLIAGEGGGGASELEQASVLVAASAAPADALTVAEGPADAVDVEEEANRSVGREGAVAGGAKAGRRNPTGRTRATPGPHRQRPGAVRRSSIHRHRAQTNAQTGREEAAERPGVVDDEAEDRARRLARLWRNGEVLPAGSSWDASNRGSGRGAGGLRGASFVPG